MMTTRLIAVMLMAAGCASAQPVPVRTADAYHGPSLTGLEPESPMEAELMEQARRHPNTKPRPHALWPDHRPLHVMPGWRSDLARRYQR